MEMSVPFSGLRLLRHAASSALLRRAACADGPLAGCEGPVSLTHAPGHRPTAGREGVSGCHASHCTTLVAAGRGGGSSPQGHSAAAWSGAAWSLLWKPHMSMSAGRVGQRTAGQASITLAAEVKEGDYGRLCGGVPRGAGLGSTKPAPLCSLALTWL